MLDIHIKHAAESDSGDQSDHVDQHVALVSGECPDGDLEEVCDHGAG
jgi:hypothetical protein